MFCLLSFFLCCLCLHITDLEQMGGVKYINTGLATANPMIPCSMIFILKPSFSGRIWAYYTLCIFRCVVYIRCAFLMGKYGIFENIL
jgi:hypothetical protein